jgi:hypothetical protein
MYDLLYRRRFWRRYRRRDLRNALVVGEISDRSFFFFVASGSYVAEFSVSSRLGRTLADSFPPLSRVSIIWGLSC